MVVLAVDYKEIGFHLISINERRGRLKINILNVYEENYAKYRKILIFFGKLND